MSSVAFSYLYQKHFPPNNRFSQCFFHKYCGNPGFLCKKKRFPVAFYPAQPLIQQNHIVLGWTKLMI